MFNRYVKSPESHPEMAWDWNFERLGNSLAGLFSGVWIAEIQFPRGLIICPCHHPDGNIGKSCLCRDFCLTRLTKRALEYNSKTFSVDGGFFSNTYGGFHKWGYPNSWMVYKGKSHLEMDEMGVPPFMETPILRKNVLPLRELSQPSLDPLSLVVGAYVGCCFPQV